MAWSNSGASPSSANVCFSMVFVQSRWVGFQERATSRRKSVAPKAGRDAVSQKQPTNQTLAPKGKRRLNRVRRIPQIRRMASGHCNRVTPRRQALRPTMDVFAALRPGAFAGRPWQARSAHIPSNSRASACPGAGRPYSLAVTRANAVRCFQRNAGRVRLNSSDTVW